MHGDPHLGTLLWGARTQSCSCGACGPQGGPGVGPPSYILQTQKQYRLDFLYVDTFIYEKYSFINGKTQDVPLGPLEGMKVFRGGGQGGKYMIHLLLQNQWVDFSQTWWGSSSGGRDQRLFMWSMLPPEGPRGRVPQREREICILNHKS